MIKKNTKSTEFQTTKGSEYSLKLILRFAQCRRCRYTFKNIFRVKKIMFRSVLTLCCVRYFFTFIQTNFRYL